jgi:hypothetical protein
MSDQEQGPAHASEKDHGENNGTNKWAVFNHLDAVTEEIEDPGHWPMLRDLAVFQGKLVLDALRDLALSPISLIAGTLGIIRNPKAPGRYFYALMKLGTRSDKWINLFGASKHVGLDETLLEEPSIDDVVERLEALVVRQYDQGGVTSQAKEAIDKAVTAIHTAAVKEVEKYKGSGKA